MTTNEADSTGGGIRLRALRKEFSGGVMAVDGVDLDVHPGEFLTLLGPSGSGKTTVLRMVAGFELPTSGSIEIAGRDVSRVPPFDRDVNTVFQDYALFPHMSVIQNVEYGLKVKKVPRDERRRRASAALASVRLEGLEKRSPKQLSGGQRQRVALARALVNHPQVLLLDEPLGALDLKLREQMQVELKGIQRQVGITFVFVTHDQEEALTMSDRVAVFNHGRIEQVGTPQEIYERPATEFVARFVGTTNLLSAEQAAFLTGVPAALIVRPERIRIDEHNATDLPEHRRVPGTVQEVVYLGAGTRYIVDVGHGVSLNVLQQNSTAGLPHVLAPGSPVQLHWQTAAEYMIQPSTHHANSVDMTGIPQS